MAQHLTRFPTKRIFTTVTMGVYNLKQRGSVRGLQSGEPEALNPNGADMDALVDSRGGRLDLFVRAGTDMAPITMTFTSDGTAPIDLTGHTLEARGATREEVPQSITFGCTITNATAGVVQLTLAQVQIDKCPAPSSVSSRPSVGGEWVLEMTTPGGLTLGMLYGEIHVGADV